MVCTCLNLRAHINKAMVAPLSTSAVPIRVTQGLSHIQDFMIITQYSWFWKSLNMAEWDDELSFFWYSCKNWCKKWNLHFHKTYDPQNWQVGTSMGFATKEYNQAGVDDFITSRSRDKLKTYLLCQSAYGRQTCQDVD